MTVPRSVGRRGFLATALVGLVALLPARAAAHHKPGHQGGPPAEGDTYGDAYRDTY